MLLTFDAAVSALGGGGNKLINNALCVVVALIWKTHKRSGG